jgi:hypothetical protein
MKVDLVYENEYIRIRKRTKLGQSDILELALLNPFPNQESITWVQQSMDTFFNSKRPYVIYVDARALSAKNPDMMVLQQVVKYMSKREKESKEYIKGVIILLESGAACYLLKTVFNMVPGKYVKPFFTTNEKEAQTKAVVCGV